MEGEIKGCLGAECPVSCCSNGMGELDTTFFKSPRANVKAQLEALGVKFTAKGRIIRQTGCSTGTACKLIEFSPDKDIRALACKIFPYKAYVTRLGGETFVSIALSLGCPATKFAIKTNDTFTAEVIALVKADWFEKFGTDVRVEIFDGVPEA